MDKFKAEVQLKSIHLKKSSFEIGDDYPRTGKFHFQFHLGIRAQEKDSLLRSYVTVEVKPNDGGDFRIFVEMVGLFEGDDNFKGISKEKFGHINAPAIIYPHIRQHIRNLSLEAGFENPIYLPILNFQRRYEASIHEQN